MMGRLVHTADFQRLLATPARCRSAHFALHHVAGVPHVPQRPSARPEAAELSTAASQDNPHDVDNSPLQAPAEGSAAPGEAAQWLGLVVPKRHARRAVTRSMIKRHARAAAARHAATLANGLWLLRVRSVYAKAQFPSAASTALAAQLQAELEQLFARASR